MTSDLPDAAAEVGEKIQEHPAYQRLVTVGLIAYGVVHLLLAFLVVQVIRGKGSDTSDAGSLATLAQLPAGRVLVAAVGVGMLALTLWQAMEALFGYPWLQGKKLAVRKLASGFRAVVYAGLGYSALKIAVGAAASADGAGAKEASRSLLALPFGPQLVALVGLGVAIAAGDQIQRGIRKSFVKYDMQGSVPRWAVRLGMVGWVAKGVTLAIVAVLFWFAAWDHDPEQAGGLDAALQKIRGQDFGQVALGAAALGFASFGVFCFVWAFNARHDVTTDDKEMP